jgi:lipopolysaccharide heptosyltransferase I
MESAPLRILLLRLSSLGDVLFSLPTLERLREAFPGARIDWVVEDRFADLLAGHPLLDEVLVYPRRVWTRSLGRPLRMGRAAATIAGHFARLARRRYDVVLDLQGNLKSLAHLRAVRAARKIGFGRGFTREAVHLLVPERVVPPREARHRTDRALSLLAPLGIDPRRPGGPGGIEPDPLLAQRWRERVRGNGSSPARPLVLVHPAVSSWGRDKEWPADRFARLAERLATDGAARVLLSWGPGEAARADEVAALSRGASQRSPETSSLRDLAALLSLADLFVGCDTGVLHLASALRRPVVGLYGPTDPAVYGPIGPGAVVVRRASPAGRRDRSRISTSMLAIEVEDVLEPCLGRLRRG